METNSESSDVFLQKMKNKKTVHILSLDGGGSKGLMEVRILDLVLKTTTSLLTNPESIQDFISEQQEDPNKDLPFLSESKRTEFVKKLDDEMVDPIQPVILFDMIVGTSTGGLIAFGLGGVMDEHDKGRLKPLTVEEVKDLYFKVSEKIFSEKAYGFFDVDEKILAMIAPDLMKFYSQAPLRTVLEGYYGDKKIKDFSTDCIIGCVAKRLEDEKFPEKSVFFSTASIKHMEVKIVDVLLATSDAPVYFQCPNVIDGKKYVDGGLGANCPLAQALDCTTQVYGKETNVVVLSIAPPSQKPEPLETDGRKQVIQWLNYFPSNMTHGTSIFNDCKQLFGGSGGIHHIRRISPECDALRIFKLDETKKLQQMFDGTTEFIINGKNGNNDDDNDDGILALVSQAITQLVPFFSSKKKSKKITSYLKTKGLEVKKNQEIYNVLIPLTLAISQRYNSLMGRQERKGAGSERKAAIETLEAGLQILELMDRDKTLQDQNRNHLAESKVFEMLGTYYREVGNLVPSKLCYLKALKKKDLLKETQVQHYIKCLMGMGDTLMYMGRDHTGSRDARSYFDEAKSILEAQEMDVTLVTKVVLQQAQFLMLKGNYNEASELLKNSKSGEASNLLARKLSLKIKLKQESSDAPREELRITYVDANTDFIRTEMEGFKYLLAKDYENSQERFETVLRQHKKAPHHEVARIMNLIGITCMKNGQNPKAETMFRKALSNMDRADGRDDGVHAIASPITAAARNGLGICLLEGGEFERAQKNFEKSRDMLEKVHGEGEKHPDIRDVLNNIAICQMKQGRQSEAGLTFQAAQHRWDRDADDLNDLEVGVDSVDSAAGGGDGDGDGDGGVEVEDRRKTVLLNYKVFQQLKLTPADEVILKPLKPIAFFH